MSHMITLDLGRAVGPINVQHEPIARLSWKSTRQGFAVTSLLTEGPKHAVMIEVTRDVLMTKIIDELRIWWEPSLVFVLEGLIENNWRKKVGNTGIYGWQKIQRHQIAIVPPEASHDRYNVRHGEDWIDPSEVIVKADSLLFLATAGKTSEPRKDLLGLELEEYLGEVKLLPTTEPLRPLTRLAAEALFHEQNDGVAMGIYQHHSADPLSFAHGMISLALATQQHPDHQHRPWLTIAGPNDLVPAAREGSWSLDAMFF